MIALENHGYLIAALAKAGRQHLPALIEAMEAGMGRTPEPITFLPIPTGENAEEYVTYLLSVVEQAHQLREKALRRLSPEERQFLFERSEEHTSELQSPCNLVCRLLLEKKKQTN